MNFHIFLNVNVTALFYFQLIIWVQRGLPFPPPKKKELCIYKSRARRMQGFTQATPVTTLSLEQASELKNVVEGRIWKLSVEDLWFRLSNNIIKANNESKRTLSENKKSWFLGCSLIYSIFGPRNLKETPKSATHFQMTFPRKSTECFTTETWKELVWQTLFSWSLR